MANYNRFGGVESVEKLKEAYEASLENAREEHSYGGKEYEYEIRLNFIESDYDERLRELTK